MVTCLVPEREKNMETSGKPCLWLNNKNIKYTFKGYATNGKKKGWRVVKDNKCELVHFFMESKQNFDMQNSDASNNLLLVRDGISLTVCNESAVLVTLL